MYEEENEHLQEGLRAKVSALKHVSVLFFYYATLHVSALTSSKRLAAL